MKLDDIEVGMRLEYVDDARYPAGTGFARPPQWVAGDVVRAKGEGECPQTAPMAMFCDAGEEVLVVVRDLMLPRMQPLETGQGVKAAKLGQAKDDDDVVHDEQTVPAKVNGLNRGGYRAVLIRFPWDVVTGLPVRNGVVRCGSSKGASLGKIRNRGYTAKSKSEPVQGSLF